MGFGFAQSDEKEMNVLLFGTEETKDGLIHEIHREGPLVMTGQPPEVVKKHLQRFLAYAQTTYDNCEITHLRGKTLNRLLLLARYNP